MHVKIQNSGKGGNSGSCGAYVNYLEKENENKKDQDKEQFFSSERDNVKGFEVVAEIDGNKHKLKKDEAKFYSVTLSPSQDELKHISNDKEKLKKFTRSAMDEYAAHFNREGLSVGKELVYFAKVEQKRQYKGTDKEVIRGEKKQGVEKEGGQTHVHVIVARMDKQKWRSLSPMSNSKGTNKAKINGKTITKGFDRSAYCEKVEQTFDRETNYNRSLEDTYTYKLAHKNLSTEEKLQQILNPKEKGTEVQAEQDPNIQKEQMREALGKENPPNIDLSISFKTLD